MFEYVLLQLSCGGCNSQGNSTRYCAHLVMDIHSIQEPIRKLYFILCLGGWERGVSTRSLSPKSGFNNKWRAIMRGRHLRKGLEASSLTRLAITLVEEGRLDVNNILQIHMLEEYRVRIRSSTSKLAPSYGVHCHFWWVCLPKTTIQPYK